MRILSLSFHYNSDIRGRRLRHSRDHVFYVEKLQNSWLFPLYPGHQSRSTDYLFSPCDLVIFRITGGKERVIVGSKLSGLPRDQITGVWITEGLLYYHMLKGFGINNWFCLCSTSDTFSIITVNLYRKKNILQNPSRH